MSVTDPGRRYVVIGAGGVGAALAAGLDEAGFPVVLVSRGRTYEAIRDRGLTYTQGGRTRVLDVDVVASADDVALTPGDVLVLATKSQDAGTLADWAWRPVHGGGVAADLPVVLTQNGLDAERLALRYFRTVVGGVALVAARHVVPGEVEVVTGPRTGQLIVGAYPSARLAPAAARVADLVAEDLRAANWLAQSVQEIERWLAWKVQANATFGVAVLSGSAEDLARLKALIVDEVRSVLGIAGYTFADPATELEYDASQASNQVGAAPHQPSTWQSFARGTGSEVDFLNGEVVLLARLHGLAAPYNAALQRVLGRSAALGEAPGTHGVDEVLALAQDDSQEESQDDGRGAVA